MKYYSKGFLEGLNTYIKTSESRKWILYVTKDVNKRVNPIRHLLLMRFLAGSAENFIKYTGSCNPFGEGPWPCLNPVTDHYRKMLINNCSIYKYANSGCAAFKCNQCGFTYTRKLDSDIYDLFNIRDYGYMWEEKLKELLGQNITENKIAKIMKCDHTTIRIYKQKLLNTKNIKDIPCDDNKLLEYKQKMYDYITNNENQSRLEIAIALNKEYYYLLKKDRKWLENVLPNRLNSVTYGNRKNWNKVDEELLISVKKAVKDILEDDKVTMVSKNSISKRCKNAGIRHKEYLNRLPKTKQFIMDNCETVENFKKRKIKNELSY